MEKSAFLGKKTPPTDTNVGAKGPLKPLYQSGKSTGSSGATLDLGRIYEHILKDERTISELPKNIQDGIRKIYRMTQDAFKYASDLDKEAFLGFGGPSAQLSGLKDYLSKVMTSKDLPKPVLDSLLSTQTAIDKELGGLQQEKINKKEQGAEQKRDNAIQQQGKKDEAVGREDAAIERVKKALMGSKRYTEIYQALPIEIRKEMEKLSLDPPNLKYLFSTRAVFASRSVVDLYLAS